MRLINKLFKPSILVLGLLVCCCSTAIGGEQEALSALEKIRTGVEEGLSLKELGQLLEGAEAQVNALKIGESDDCVRAAAKRSYHWYRLGVKSSETLTKHQEERDTCKRQIEYGDHSLREIRTKMLENYEKLIKQGQEALPSKWAYGNAELERARQCLSQ